jgi:hypothetical protein
MRRMQQLLRLGALFVILALSASLSAREPEEVTLRSMPQITIQAFREWKVEYRMEQQARSLVFPRSPDNSRAQGWIPEADFEIVSSERGEVARRRDGAPFTSASFMFEPKYIPREKDYAPFSPFGDGGMLFHTGRLFACPDVCLDDAEWSMQLLVIEPDRIIVNSRREAHSASWTDHGDGRKIFVGKSDPIEMQSTVPFDPRL